MPPRMDPRMLQLLMMQQQPQQPQGLTLNSGPPPVQQVGGGAPYGAVPIQPGGFAGDQGQGMPYTGTMERSMVNMDQAKLLQKAIQALRAGRK